MSIISKMERRSPWGRFVISLIFLFLTLAGLTILYPFALMVSGSLRSEMDETQLRFVPQYLVDTDELYRKFLEYKYSQSIDRANRAHLAHYFRFNVADVPEAPSRELAGALEEFLQEADLPEFWYQLGGIMGRRTIPANARRFRERVATHFGHDLDLFRQETGVVTDSWLDIIFPSPDWTSRMFFLERDILYDIYCALMVDAPLAELVFSLLDGHFLETIIYPRYGRTTPAMLVKANPGLDLDCYSAFVLPERVPPAAWASFRADWLEFAQEEVNASFVVVDADQRDAFREALRKQHGDIATLNRAWGSRYSAFADIALPDGRTWLTGGLRSDYETFLRTVPPETLRLVDIQSDWSIWLKTRYEGNLSAAKAALGVAASSFDRIRLPVDHLEYFHVLDHARPLRWQMARQNHVNVIDTLFTHGRTLYNTVVYCVLVVSLNLLINPMAAYALSRFKLRGTYKFLFILMATSAFPPMVTLIPQFVILQNLNLMNTFIALLLPTLVNGYLVFLLKGFFDSLPQELYDAAVIDGASEMRVFFQITMALSKPILAVVALQAYNNAYTAFLYPLLVAPDPDMWLISVWLYQFQQQFGMSGVFASVLVASIPTIILFLIAQNIILRGIAVPVEK